MNCHHPVIPVCRPLLPDADRLLPYLRRIDASRIYSNNGELARLLACRLSEELLGGKNRVALAANGTAALTAAVMAAAGPARPGAPLCAMPAYSFIASAHAAEQAGYRPYLVDVCAETWMLCPDAMLRHPLLDRIGVVMPVSAYGRPVDQAGWAAFARATGVPVVIDGAAAIEALVTDPAATLGAVPVVLSLHATKAFATGEGGAVVTTDRDLLERTAAALNFGFAAERTATVRGLNGKLSEYHAAVGLAELDGWAGKRSGFAAAIAAYGPSARLPALHVGPVAQASCYALVDAGTAAAAGCLTDRLDHHRIGWRRWYGNGIHGHPGFADVGRDGLSVTEALTARLIGIPMSVDLSREDAARVVTALSPPPAAGMAEPVLTAAML